MTNVTADVTCGIEDRCTAANGFRTTKRTESEHKSQATTQKHISTSQDKLVASQEKLETCQKELKSKVKSHKGWPLQIWRNNSRHTRQTAEGIMAVVQQQAQNLHKFSSELQVTWNIKPATWSDIMVTPCNLEVTFWKFKMQLAVVEGWTSCRGGQNAETSTIMVKPPQFHRSMPWAVFNDKSRP